MRVLRKSRSSWAKCHLGRQIQSQARSTTFCRRNWGWKPKTMVHWLDTAPEKKNSLGKIQEATQLKFIIVFKCCENVFHYIFLSDWASYILGNQVTASRNAIFSGDEIFSGASFHQVDLHRTDNGHHTVSTSATLSSSFSTVQITFYTSLFLLVI